MDIFSKFIIISTLLMLFNVIRVFGASCSDFKDCRSCTSHETWDGTPCPWCPTSKSCHAKWSFFNPCKSSQNKRSVSECPAMVPVDKNSVVKNYKYNATEAYKLAVFSSVAYGNKPGKCLDAALPNNNYSIVEILLRECDDYLFDYHWKCMAFVTVSKQNKEVIVAFRGTVGFQQLIDQAITTLFSSTVTIAVGGEVQPYFNHVHNKFYSSLKTLITKLKAKFPDYKFKITGHSLGGAVASITSAMLVKENILKSDDVSLYTFGMPRVGNKEFALAHDKLVPDSWRVVRKGDIVTKLPSCDLFITCSSTNGPHHHGNKVIYYNDTMTKTSPYAVCDGNEDALSECTKIENQEIAAQKKRKRRAIEYKVHTNFFGIRIGLHCNNQGFKRK